MKRLLVVLVGTCLLLVSGLLPARGEAAEAPVIRAALDQGVPMASFTVCEGGYTLTDEATGIPLGTPRHGETWTVSAAGTSLTVRGPGLQGNEIFQGPLLLQEEGEDRLNLFQYRGVQYRGGLMIHQQKGSLLVVNLLDLEKYLYGVVGKEMGGGAAPEAFCVQAVVSRSYALSLRGLDPWYDVGKDTGTQVYGGYTGEIAFAMGGTNPVAEAVERTRGEVLKYKGTLVHAYFHSNAGGYTEDSENVWLESLPYLRAVSSPADSYAESVGGWAAGTYRWTKVINRKELEAKLGIGEIRDVRLSRNRTRISRDPLTGKLSRDFLPGTTTSSGRVTGVTVVGSQGTKSFYRDNIRAPFNLKSTLFDLSFEGQLQILNALGETRALSGGEAYVVSGGNRTVARQLSSSETYVIGKGNQIVSQAASFDQLIFTGKGYGHGLGMSQWGARGLAAEGYNYRDILEIYYNQGKHNGDLKITPGYGI